MTAEEVNTEKSTLTTMLAESPETSRIHDIFAAVPRKLGGERESSPLETLQVPRGADFYWVFISTAVITLCISYVCMVGLGLIFTWINMMSGSCGQEKWGLALDDEGACNQLVTNSLAFSIELRCLSEKPANMTMNDFDGVCGSDAWIGAIICVTLMTLQTIQAVRKELGKLPSQVYLYEHFFVVESWNRKFFTGSFYGDVTSAKTGRMGLDIITIARFDLRAGGEDESDKKGNTLKVVGNGSVSVLAGHGKEQEHFLEALGKHLPTKIEGYEGATKSPQEGALSLITGNFDTILKARKGELESVSIQKPFTCDFATDGVVITLFVLVGWYVLTTLQKSIGWAIGRSQGKCDDPLRPGVDLCAVWRIFVPLEHPLVQASDYIGVVLLVCFVIGVPAYFIFSMPKEYKFHQEALLQECRLAGWESQDSKIVFASDIKGLEMVDGSLEKYVKVQTKAVYTIRGGLQKPFEIDAEYAPAFTEVKVGVVDVRCASCSGHRQEAIAYRSSLIESFKTMKPGFLADESSV